MVITAITFLFVNTTDLLITSSFAGSTFLLIFAAINLSAIRLRTRININVVMPLTGLLLSLAFLAVLFIYFYKTDLKCLTWIEAIYLCVIISELCFSERKFPKLRAGPERLSSEVGEPARLRYQPYACGNFFRKP